MVSFISPFVASTKRPLTQQRGFSNTSSTSPRRPAPSSSSRLLKTAFAGIALYAVYRSSVNSNVTTALFGSKSTNKMGATNLNELTGMKDIDGNVLDASVFKGKVVFAMNVASACGYTKSGYDLLKRLTTKFSADDFVAVAIPCNSFGWQENGSEESIKLFALSRAERLVVTERSVVNGDKPHPIVEVAKNKFPGRIGWNFDGRFVFDRNGAPAARFGNSNSADEIEASIEKLI